LILALDPSLCATGWCIAPLPESPVDELLTGVITTEPSPKKQRLYQAEDDAQRALKLYRALQDLVMIGPAPRNALELPQYAVEQPTGSQSARGAAALKLVQGLIIGFCGTTPIRWVLAAEAKVALCGKKGASKEQMVAAAVKRGLKLTGNKVAQEAMADAFAVLLASGLWRPAYVTVPVDATKMRVSGFASAPHLPGRKLKPGETIQVYETPWPSKGGDAR